MLTTHGEDILSICCGDVAAMRLQGTLVERMFLPFNLSLDRAPATLTRRPRWLGILAATSGGLSETLDPSDDGCCCNFRGHMPRFRNHRIYLAWRHYGSDRNSRREGICLVLDFSRERRNRSWIAGVVDSTNSQGRRRCLTSRSTRTTRRKRWRAIRPAPD